MPLRKDISKYIYKYFIEKDEKENFVKGIVKWEQKLDTELDGSMLFNDIYSKSKADDSQILNEVQNLFATGQPHR
jgi:hypothetical protein